MIDKRAFMLGFIIAHCVEKDIPEGMFSSSLAKYCKRYDMTPPTPVELAELALFMKYVARAD